MLDNTRHEKAVLIIASYVIGFTTAVIAMGFAFDTDTQEDSFNFNYVRFNETARHAEGNNTSKSLYEGDLIDSVAYRNGNLIALVAGKEIVLSTQSLSQGLTFEQIPKNGTVIHDILSVFSLSPDNSMIHFCTALQGEDQCMHYIYDVATNSVHPVVYDGAKFKTTTATAMNTSWEDGTLSIQDFSSKNSEESWIME